MSNQYRRKLRSSTRQDNRTTAADYEDKPDSSLAKASKTVKRIIQSTATVATTRKRGAAKAIPESPVTAKTLRSEISNWATPQWKLTCESTLSGLPVCLIWDVKEGQWWCRSGDFNLLFFSW